MHDSDSSLHLVKQMMRARQQEAAAAAVRSRHSRSGMLGGFLRRLADRIDPTGEERREL